MPSNFSDILDRLTNVFPIITWSDIINLKMIFLSVIIEALPFILIGVLISAILNNFLSEQLIQRILPKNILYAILPACFLGVLFPLCECGIVPITRRLVSKGVPLPIAIAFMLATPIINPVVAIATAVAFGSNPLIMWIRLGLALFIASTTGLLLGFLFRGPELRRHFNLQLHSDNNCGCNSHSHSQLTLWDKILGTLLDTCNEFFEMGKYLILGAFLSAAAQTFISRTLLLGIGQDSFLSIAVMMLFAFGVSVCSTADAFIAASFSTSFTLGSLFAFMVFGPMIDLKNTLMLLHTFRFRLVMALVFITVLLTGGMTYLFNLLITGVL